MCQVADESVLPILQDIVQNTDNEASRLDALNAMARLRPEMAVQYILIKLKNKSPKYNELGILRKHANQSDLDSLYALLYPDSKSERKLDTDDVHLLLERFGTRGKTWLLENRDRFSPNAWTWAQWLIGDLKIEQLLGDMRAAGIVQQSPEELLSLVAARRYNSLSSKGWSSVPLLLEETLKEAGLCTEFDSECGQIPPDNALIMREFARHSNDRFQPECQIQLHADLDQVRGNIFYTVCFIFLGRLYRFVAKYHGDYYSTSEVVCAMNTALRISGRPERYIGIDTESQDAEFIFADPHLFLPIAKRYHLPIYKEEFLKLCAVIDAD